jgi:hypothetical protein
MTTSEQPDKAQSLAQQENGARKPDAEEPAADELGALASRLPPGESPPVNPFAPPSDVDGSYAAASETDASPASRPSLARSISTWTFICIVSAAPSFFWGWSTVAQEQVLAMLLGILVFIIGYICADQSRFAHRLRQNRNTQIALRFTYGTRIAISVLFPVAGFVDALVGMASISITFTAMQAVGLDPRLSNPTARFDEAGFVACFVTTIVQGVLLNCVLAAYGCVVWVIAAAIRSR